MILGMMAATGVSANPFKVPAPLGTGVDVAEGGVVMDCCGGPLGRRTTDSYQALLNAGRTGLLDLSHLTPAMASELTESVKPHFRNAKY